MYSLIAWVIVAGRPDAGSAGQPAAPGRAAHGRPRRPATRSAAGWAGSPAAPPGDATRAHSRPRPCRRSRARSGCRAPAGAAARWGNASAPCAVSGRAAEQDGHGGIMRRQLRTGPRPHGLVHPASSRGSSPEASTGRAKPCFTRRHDPPVEPAAAARTGRRRRTRARCRRLVSAVQSGDPCRRPDAARDAASPRCARSRGFRALHRRDLARCRCLPPALALSRQILRFRHMLASARGRARPTIAVCGELNRVARAGYVRDAVAAARDLLRSSGCSGCARWAAACPRSANSTITAGLSRPTARICASPRRPARSPRTGGIT